MVWRIFQITAVYHTNDSVFHQSHAKINNQAYFQTREDKVCPQLLGKNRIHRSSGFQFNNNFAIYKQIKPKRIFKRLVFIRKANGFLAFHSMPALLQLYRQHSLVN